VLLFLDLLPIPQRKNHSRHSSRAAPTTEPITMPATAPWLRLEDDEEEETPPVEELTLLTALLVWLGETPVLLPLLLLLLEGVEDTPTLEEEETRPTGGVPLVVEFRLHTLGGTTVAPVQLVAMVIGMLAAHCEMVSSESVDLYPLLVQA